MATVTKWGFHVPALADQADVPNWMNQLATDLGDVGKWRSGTLAGLGAAPAIAGMSYYATDTGQEFFYTGTAWIERTTAPGIPIGASIRWNGINDPADTRFLLEDGRLLLRATYPAAFAVMQTRNNTGGEPADSFRLADTRGRVDVSPDNMGTPQGAAGRMPFVSSGAAGGASQTTIATNQLPSHSHPVSDPGHAHIFLGGATALTVSGGYANYNTGPSAAGTVTQTDGALTGVTVGNTGGNNPIPLIQPYIARNSIVRVR